MQLAIYHDDSERTPVRRLDIPDDDIVIGSARTCTVVIDTDPEIAPHHLRLVCRDRIIAVPYAGIVTRLDGTPITRPAIVPTGSVLQIGSTILRPTLASVVATRTGEETEPRFVPGRTYNPPMPRPLPPSNPPAPPGPLPRWQDVAPLPRQVVTPPTIWRSQLSTELLEHDFLVSLRANPADPQTRSVYADWLEQRGDVVRAAYVRGEAEDRRAVLEHSDPDWRAITSCSLIDLCANNECPLAWQHFEALAGEERIRRCATCTRLVRYCLHVLDPRGCAQRGEGIIRDLSIVGDPDPDAER